MSKAKILYVEDDERLAFVTTDNLQRAGYEVLLGKTGREGFDLFSNNQFEICILDVMLPGMDGFELARKIREMNDDIPILFLSAKSMAEDRIEGLLTGADDFLTKPFSIEELILKIEVFLKRSNAISPKTTQTIWKIGQLIFDSSSRVLKSKNSESKLTSRETELLKLLIKNRNSVVKKEDILLEVWGNDSYFNSRSLDVFVSKLRKHLKTDPEINLNNVHGIGFILSVN